MRAAVAAPQRQRQWILLSAQTFDERPRPHAAVCGFPQAGGSRACFPAAPAQPGIGDEGATLLSLALRAGQCALRELALDGCGVGDVGVGALATALLEAPRGGLLERLSLSSNHVSDAGCAWLAPVLRRVGTPLWELQASHATPLYTRH